MQDSRSTKLSVWVLAAAVVVAEAASIRQWHIDSSTESAVSAYGHNQPAGEIVRNLSRAQAWGIESGRAFTISGLVLYAAAISAPAEARDSWLAMASTSFAEAVKREPLSDAALRGLAMTAQRLGFPEEARTFGSAAIRRGPQNPDNHWVSARLYGRGSTESAAGFRMVTALRPALSGKVVAEASPELTAQDVLAATPESWLAWVESLPSALERGAQARNAYQALAADRLSPALGWLAYYGGLEYIESAPETAAFWLNQAVTHIKNEQAFLRNYGFALYHSGRYGEAENAFKKSISLFDDLNNAAYLGLAETEEQLGNSAEALHLFERMARNRRLEEWIQRRAQAGIVRIEHKRAKGN